MDNKEAVDRWLEQIKAMQPADGRLTEEIIESVGDLPLPMRTASVTTEEEEAMDELIREAGDRAVVKAYASTWADLRSTEAGSQIYDLMESGGAKEEMAKYRAQMQYFKSVAQWIDQL
jgi:hypothetical protein